MYMLYNPRQKELEKKHLKKSDIQTGYCNYSIPGKLLNIMY